MCESIDFAGRVSVRAKLVPQTRLFNSNPPFSTLRSVEQVGTLTQVVENERDWRAADLLLSMNLAKVRNVARSKQ
jgi:hypothetical protein